MTILLKLTLGEYHDMQGPRVRRAAMGDTWEGDKKRDPDLEACASQSKNSLS